MKDQTMPEAYSDETLMAFADGLLDEPLFSSVADAVESDAAVAERLEQLVSGASLARDGFAPLLEPVSPELEASVRAMIARRQRQPWWDRFNLGGLLPLAGAAVVVVAIGVAVPLLQPGNDGALGGLRNRDLQAALDTLPSGGHQTLRDGQNLHAVASFTAADGRLCREFEVPGYVMVACRQDGQWQVTLATASASGEDAYRTASGLAVLDAYLGEIGAGAPMAIEEEAAALEN